MTRQRWRLLGVIAVVLIAVLSAAIGRSGGGDTDRVEAGGAASSAVPTQENTSTRSPASTSVVAAPAGGVAPAGSGTRAAPTGTTLAPGLDLVALSRLPDEAADTWALIEDGGPFPFDRDGVTFENRERILPRRERGFYREYTVPTPGEDDRGARRLVVGEDDAVFYTGDHYDSFVQVDVER